MEGDCNVYPHSSLWMRPTRPDRYNAKVVYNLWTKYFTTAITPKLHRDGHPSSTLGDELVERQGQLHACIHTGVSEWNMSSEKLKILYFWNWNCALWWYKRKFRSGHEQKKKRRKYMQKKKQQQQNQFLRPIWPKFCIWEEILIIFC